MIKIVPTNNIPEANYCRRHNLQDLIKEFVNSDMKICEFKFNIPTDYKHTKSADNTIRVAVKCSGENIKVHIRKGRIYLEKQIEG